MRPRCLYAALPLAMTMGLAAFAQNPPPAKTDETTKHFLVEMACLPTDRDEVSKTIQMALTLRQDKNEVTLFIDGAAVHLAQPTNEVQAKELQRESAGLFAKLRAAGVTVLVCPHCAEVEGVPAKSLRQGVRFTTKQELEATRERADQIFVNRPKAPAASDKEKIAIENRTT